MHSDKSLTVTGVKVLNHCNFTVHICRYRILLTSTRT